ncbi:hypothetical protein TNCV_2679781 [Trichonephila clavipes]|nr:hypothetical protein TNCV_2679781 [Trichonephila clavipes]
MVQVLRMSVQLGRAKKIRSRGKHIATMLGTLRTYHFQYPGTSLPRTASQGVNYLLVVMDYFTKPVEVYPISVQEAPRSPEAVVQHWMRSGVPLQLIPIQGRGNFVMR